MLKNSTLGYKLDWRSCDRDLCTPDVAASLYSFGTFHWAMPPRKRKKLWYSLLPAHIILLDSPSPYVQCMQSIVFFISMYLFCYSGVNMKGIPYFIRYLHDSQLLKIIQERKNFALQFEQQTCNNKVTSSLPIKVLEKQEHIKYRRGRSFTSKYIAGRRRLKRIDT